MADLKHEVRIGSRGSPLALAQANLFASLLVRASGGAIAHEIQSFTTTGDKITDKPLTEAGGKGLFTKELDRAQERHEIDIAVHSLKDMMTTLPDHLYIAAHLPREDPRDCLIGPWSRVADLPDGAIVGSSSLRRRAQLLALRPDLRCVDFRGNVQTRLRKLADGQAQATILAAAGLNRLDMMDAAAGVIPVEDMLPAAAQGIIAVTLRVDAPQWLRDAVAKTDDRSARLAAAAERAFLRRLDGSCRTPIAAHFQFTPPEDQASIAWMAGEVLSDDGAQRWRAEATLARELDEGEAETLGRRLGDEVAGKRDAG